MGALSDAIKKGRKANLVQKWRFGVFLVVLGDALSRL
jgi:hypothetical protein